MKHRKTQRQRVRFSCVLFAKSPSSERPLLSRILFKWALRTNLTKDTHAVSCKPTLLACVILDFTVLSIPCRSSFSVRIPQAAPRIE